MASRTWPLPRQPACQVSTLRRPYSAAAPGSLPPGERSAALEQPPRQRTRGWAGGKRRERQVAASQQPSVSVVVPIMNEVDNIPLLVQKIGDVMQSRGGTYEVICVDDGSTDGSTAALKSLAETRADVRAVVMRRNFGQSAAMAAGFDLSTGDLLVTLDGDLQNDPADIPMLLDALLRGAGCATKDGGGAAVREAHGGRLPDGGFDMVVGWRKKRKDNFLLRNLPSMAANWLIGRVTGVKLRDYGCSLKAYRRPLVECVRLYGELHRFLPVLAAAEGACIGEVEVSHHPRTAGQSKYGLGRIPRVLMDLLALQLLAKFRDRPMRLFGYLGGTGVAGSLATLAAACRQLLRQGGRGRMPAVAPLVALSFLILQLSLVMIGLGFLAEMVMRTYFESQPRAPYRVREVVNVEL